MSNRANLITPQELNARLTPEERRINAQKAGLSSAEARQQRNTLREDFMTLLDCEREDGTTVQECLSIAMMNKAIKGDVRAAEFIRDTVEGKPATQVNLKNEAPTPVVLVGYDDIPD